ncbi:autotransporter outer membrane beta-barrel domain-containing protein [Bartonella queenslandensis]|uniref:autotransporter outer membrane beta-barrel domain-containing protein n=1 Tax=Bartonella queenslandensis TaxID=481138 RepID=UPI001BAA6B05|nr:autotransporter outer membrane beta-barrel domain-containing protein [Bartonella queenslandensis]
MCKKSIYKKNLLLCTIAGTFIFSHFGSTYANTQPPEIINEFKLEKEEKKTLDNVFIRNKKIGVSAAEKAIATITNSTIHTESAAFSVSKGGNIHAKGIDANSIYKGLETKNGVINIEDSIITVQGGGAGGIVLYETPKNEIKEGENVINRISLTRSKLLVKDGVGIRGPYGSKSIAEISLKDSEIRADVLLRNKTRRKYYDDDTLPVSLILTANNSILEGRARTLKINTTTLTLNNNSKWYLKVSQEDIDTDFNTFNFDLSDLKQRALSTVSIVNLNNSSIIFNAPSANAPSALGKGQYQILSVGKTAEVYESRDNMVPTVETAYYATGNVSIYFNTEWSDGLEVEQQKTDHLLVHGNVSGTTTIYFNNLSNNKKSETEDFLPLNARGLSLIQVSGEASETSFKLANGYVTMAGLPYRYVLNAYGPTSSHGRAESTQSLLGKISQESEENTLKDFTSYVIKKDTRESVLEGVSKDKGNAQSENFWDFRLQNATLDNEGKIRALVAQVASYLVMPNAIFSTGLSDVSNQNALLDDMRTTVTGTKDHKNKGLFLSSYGNKMTLSSSRSPLQYGYGADVHYAALQAGVILAALEEQNIAMNFGLLGTYGKLSFTPKDMEGADKSTLDKWSLAAYGDFHHNNGLHVNALFSYGVLKGNVTTALIGKTAELTDANTFSVSATIGQKFETSAKGLVFEPQAQFVYQSLMIGIFSDVDGFDVNMGNPHQWLVRVGGRLTQTTLPIEGGSSFSFYGKLNIVKAFSNNTTIQIGDKFHFDSMGSALEGGIGVNTQLSQNIAFHADVNYQQKLQKAGISGINVSGGIRYRF